jgi:hypothetical protein
MSNKKAKYTGYNQPKRLSFPADAKIHSWLSMLLDAYYLVDRGIAEAVKMESGKGRKLACSKGCSSCCKTHSTIPVYPVELVGLSWYVTEKIQGPGRELVKTQLRNYKENDPCPIRKYVDRAFFIMLPFYGIQSEAQRWKIIESGGVHQVVKLMQTCNWKSLAEKMEEFDTVIGIAKSSIKDASTKHDKYLYTKKK